MQAILLLSGVVTMSALPAVFMPREWMDHFHHEMGLGSFPAGPLAEYLARSLSFFYAAFGLATLITASDPYRYRTMVFAWGWFATVFGATVWWISHVSGMPPMWTWGEGPLLIPAGLLVLTLGGRWSAGATKDPSDQDPI